MPNYNCEKFVAETLDSVLAQTYNNWELLIVDDCSTDNSVKIIRDYCEKDERIKLFINDKNSGAAASRNRARLPVNGLDFLTATIYGCPKNSKNKFRL